MFLLSPDKLIDIIGNNYNLEWDADKRRFAQIKEKNLRLSVFICVQWKAK